MSALSEEERRQERAGRVALLDTLADVLLRELDERLASRLATDPLLSTVLRPPVDETAHTALRQEYARLLLLDVQPYSSLYLDVPACIGGASARRWESLLQECGFAPSALERAAASDHAGLVLRALAQAERAGRSAPVLAEALRWLPAYLTALERNDPAGFYGRVAALTTSVLQLCALSTQPEALGCMSGPFPVARVPEPETPQLESVREIARRLATPAESGLYLSKHELRQLAAIYGVGLGIVDRVQMFEEVFAASALDARTADLLDALERVCTGWAATATRWSAAIPQWSPIMQRWRGQLDTTVLLLGELRAGASDFPS